MRCRSLWERLGGRKEERWGGKEEQVLCRRNLEIVARAGFGSGSRGSCREGCCPARIYHGITSVMTSLYVL